jgi:hypothetical protein
MRIIADSLSSAGCALEAVPLFNSSAKSLKRNCFCLKCDCDQKTTHLMMNLMKLEAYFIAIAKSSIELVAVEGSGCFD